jgi:hypothetical protein
MRQLAELNALLCWRAFTVDRQGRRFGGVAWAGFGQVDAMETRQERNGPRAVLFAARAGAP